MDVGTKDEQSSSSRPVLWSYAFRKMLLGLAYRERLGLGVSPQAGPGARRRGAPSQSSRPFGDAPSRGRGPAVGRSLCATAAAEPRNLAKRGGPCPRGIKDAWPSASGAGGLPAFPRSASLRLCKAGDPPPPAPSLTPLSPAHRRGASPPGCVSATGPRGQKRESLQ
jgi:hypothetical protein